MSVVSAVLADITSLDVDAIVNAANPRLVPGGGVCGAIHRAAGPDLARACAAVAPCPVGDARITPGFHLKARFVIHAVGPVWQGGGHREPDLLAAAYRASLLLAGNHALISVAFPAISTGIFGYPLEDATDVAVATVRDTLRDAPSLTKVVFACFGDEALRVYEAAGVDVSR